MFSNSAEEMKKEKDDVMGRMAQDVEETRVRVIDPDDLVAFDNWAKKATTHAVNFMDAMIQVATVVDKYPRKEDDYADKAARGQMARDEDHTRD